ncbi:MAG: heavy metal-associated domain-containing protein [Planctomycetota bacterium]
MDEAVPAASAEPVATISASGMSCPLCASNIDRRLSKVDGVKWTNIDLGNGVVTVGLEADAEAPTAEDLQTAIRDAGYTAGEVTMPDGEVTP